MCTAGDLIDPDTKLHMRKALTIMTSSKSLFHDMCGLKCSGKHEHQEIEGSCHVNGKTMNRSSFSENYPRKFARRVAKCLCKVRIPKESPYRWQEEQELWSWTLAGADVTQERNAKRPKVGLQARLNKSRARHIANIPWGKRTKITGKTTTLDAQQKWKDVFDKILKEVPRGLVR